MGGGLMQLVAYGAQDVYLTGNPQITFWKVTYRRHTNFALESIEQTFNGQADFGRRVTCTISRNGDLAYRTYLQVTLPEINQDMHNPRAFLQPLQRPPQPRAYAPGPHSGAIGDPQDGLAPRGPLFGDVVKPRSHQRRGVCPLARLPR